MVQGQKCEQPIEKSHSFVEIVNSISSLNFTTCQGVLNNLLTLA